MTDPVLSQLVSVESDLIEQIKQVEAQLTQLQTKRQGLHTVISLFGDDNGKQTTSPVAKTALESPPETLEAAPEIAPEVAPTESTEQAAVQAEATSSTPATKKSTKATKSKSSAAKSASKTSTQTSNTAPVATKSRAKAKTKAKAGRKKKDGRAATWQKYVQAKYRELALPESVSSVLRSTPSEVFTIAEVMSALFKEDMPRTAYLKARNRISNILSAGARDGTWYKGRNGRYSQSESVTKIK
ncbi:MAG: hypothetical protein WA984_10515 [Phormidesmis sp.]